jgi:hypothetical protein
LILARDLRCRLKDGTEALVTNSGFTNARTCVILIMGAIRASILPFRRPTRHPEFNYQPYLHRPARHADRFTFKPFTMETDMKLSKKVQRTLMASAVMLVAGAGSAKAAAPVDEPFGACTGALGTDCVAGTGHASVSISNTLSINEMRAISFGNFASTALLATDNVILGIDGSRTATGFVPLNGTDGGAGGGGAGDPLETGGQSPGHFTVTGGGAADAVYISFAQTDGTGIDMCDSNGDCDDYHNGSSVDLGGGFTVDHFTINETGSDVYGHYVATDAPGESPGISDPWLPGSATGSGHDSGATNGSTKGEIDIVVGATLHSAAGTPAAGKYAGTFNIMVSY